MCLECACTCAQVPPGCFFMCLVKSTACSHTCRPLNAKQQSYKQQQSAEVLRTVMMHVRPDLQFFHPDLCFSFSEVLEADGARKDTWLLNVCALKDRAHVTSCSS